MKAKIVNIWKAEPIADEVEPVIIYVTGDIPDRDIEDEEYDNQAIRLFTALQNSLPQAILGRLCDLFSHYYADRLFTTWKATGWIRQISEEELHE